MVCGGKDDDEEEEEFVYLPRSTSFPITFDLSRSSIGFYFYGSYMDMATGYVMSLFHGLPG